MLNPIEAYQHAGKKAAEARHHRDESLARHWSDWVARACAMETPEDRVSARTAYADAYKDEAASYHRGWA